MLQTCPSLTKLLPIYPTLAKRYLVWLYVEVFGRPLCVTPELFFEFLLLILPRAKNFLCKSLVTLSLWTLASGNWAAKSARSPGRKFLVPLLLWNSIARKDRWGWLNCGLGGIFILESLSWAKEYNIELEKQQNNLGKIHHMSSHIYLCEKGLVFYLYLQEFHMDLSLPTLIFAMANFDKRKFFLDTLYDNHPSYSNPVNPLPTKPLNEQINPVWWKSNREAEKTKRWT